MPQTIAAWLETRTPAAPPLLSARIREMLGESVQGDVNGAADVLLDVAARELAQLLAGDQRARECAVELLAVDALVTYAFEAAASDPERLEARARDAMARMSAVSASPAPAGRADIR